MLSSVFTQFTAPLFSPDSVLIRFLTSFFKFFVEFFEDQNANFFLLRLKNRPSSINLRTVAVAAAAASGREARVTQEVFQLSAE